MSVNRSPKRTANLNNANNTSSMGAKKPNHFSMRKSTFSKNQSTARIYCTALILRPACNGSNRTLITAIGVTVIRDNLNLARLRRSRYRQ